VAILSGGRNGCVTGEDARWLGGRQASALNPTYSAFRRSGVRFAAETASIEWKALGAV
jgi:hypothetical protein